MIRLRWSVQSSRPSSTNWSSKVDVKALDKEPRTKVLSWSQATWFPTSQKPYEAWWIISSTHNFAILNDTHRYSGDSKQAAYLDDLGRETCEECVGRLHAFMIRRTLFKWMGFFWLVEVLNVLTRIHGYPDGSSLKTESAIAEGV